MHNKGGSKLSALEEKICQGCWMINLKKDFVRTFFNVCCWQDSKMFLLAFDNKCLYMKGSGIIKIVFTSLAEQWKINQLERKRILLKW